MAHAVILIGCLIFNCFINSFDTGIVLYVPDEVDLLDQDAKTLWVTATAYNSLAEQTTQQNPALGAWGDHLSDGIKAIAVSKDLIALGLTYRTKVRIEGLGVYTVLDRMPDRWTRKIDIFMGKDKEAAIHWGKRKVRITFPVEE